MSQFMNGLYNLLETWQPLIWILAAIVLMVIGVGCTIPSEKIKTFCKGHIVSVVIGVGIALCATIIAKEISSAWAF